MRTRSIAISLCLGAVLAGCGSRDPGGDASPTPTTTPTPGDPGRLLPMIVGASWTYRITDPETSTVSTKTRTIETLEDVGDRKTGITAYRMRVDNANGYSLSWFEDLGAAAGVVRHREQSFTATGVHEKDEFYEAFKLRVDESEAHVTNGATWTETYVETIVKPGLPEVSEEEIRNWTVEAVAESVSVPAGMFDALRVRRVSPAGGTDKTLWFAAGIGIVRETEAGVEEAELTTWSFPATE